MSLESPARSFPPQVAADVQERIHRLWDELTAFEAAQTEAALMHLLSVVATLVDAENAYWMGAVKLAEDARDPLNGWRPRILRYLRPLPNDESFTQQRLRAVQRGEVDEATAAQARRAGTFRSCRLQDLVSPEWFKSDTYQGYLGRRVYDSLTVGVPVNPTAEGYYGFLRMRPDAPFTEAQRDIAFCALRGLAWFHRQVLLSHGVRAATAPLSPMERRVLAQLLTDHPEKLIAENLGVTASSVHTYVKSVLKKLGVSGRQGLMAIWLRKQS